MEESNFIINRKVYPVIDIAKFIACICVIAIHTAPLSNANENVEWCVYTGLFLLAVPFFFVSSGFFLGEKLVNGQKSPKEIIINYIKRLLIPYVAFSFVNIFQNVVLMLMNDIAPKDIIINVIRSIIFYPYGALWFIWACIVGTLLLYPFIRKGKLSNVAIFIGLILYCFSLLCSSYKSVTDSTFLQPIIDNYLKIFISHQNGVLTGFLFLGIGIKCAEIVKKYTIDNTKVLVLFLVAYLSIWIEKSLLKILFECGNEANYVLSFVFAIPLLVILVANMHCEIPTKISITLRHLSTGMYFLHRPIIFFVEILSLSNFLEFIIVTCISFFICIVTYKLKPKYIYNLLK